MAGGWMMSVAAKEVWTVALGGCVGDRNGFICDLLLLLEERAPSASGSREWKRNHPPHLPARRRVARQKRSGDKNITMTMIDLNANALREGATSSGLLFVLGWYVAGARRRPIDAALTSTDRRR